MTRKLKLIRVLTDDDFLYLQENYVVTDGIFKDENIIFDNITTEWIDFCKNMLLFEVPVYEPVKVEASRNQENSNS